MANAIKLLTRHDIFTKAQGDDKQVCLSSSDDDVAQDLTDFKTALGLTQSDVLWGATTVTATTYTVLSTDDIVLVNDTTAGAAVTVTLPLVSSLPSGYALAIKKIGNSYNVTVDASGSDTIDGGGSALLTSQYEAIRMVSNGSNWYIV